MNTKGNTGMTRNCLALLRVAAMSFVLWMSPAPAAHGQGTLTFDGPKFTQNYYEQGFWFRTVPGDAPLESVRMSGVDDLVFAQSLSGYYVSLSLTGGGTFGLSSVDLNGRYYNGTTVQFQGYFADGSMVSNSFSVPYDSQWNTHQFGSGFLSGLVRVDIPSYPWAMDNLVYVPEPGVGSMLLLVLLAWRRAILRKRD